MLEQLVTDKSDMPGESQSDLTHPGLRLMSNFWNILKDDPNCNLPELVQNYYFHQRSATSCKKRDSTETTFLFPPRVLQCYMAQLPDQSDGAKKQDQSPNPTENVPSAPTDPSDPVPVSAPPMPTPDQPPLKKVLTNLNNAARFDSQCQAKLKELLAAEKYLKSQISKLELKEKQGIQMMKQADEMWLEMENTYKEKIAQSSERQQGLINQLQDIEKSAAKWRKNKRDLESQIGILNKCQSELMEKVNQKTNDLKSLDNEIAAYKKRIENTKKESEALKKTMAQNKEKADKRLEYIKQEINNLQKQVQEETKSKNYLVEQGKRSVEDSRADLQKICKTLLQRRLEAEDLEAEKKALIEEIEALKKTCDHCKERCSNRQKSIVDEIKKTELEIANFTLKCRKCSQCVDCRDFRTLCTDCPRCQEYRVCKVLDKECRSDPAEECVCSKVKGIFLNNVLENMSTVLERTVKTNAGKALGGEILSCLKKSTNAKLNDRTRKIIQTYVLQSVKQNLNLTIVGGAVKTRCELDSDTYQQLMLCMKGVKPTPPPKAEKGTNVKKEPCKHWGGDTECNCPKGPDRCICTTKAPPTLKDPKTCPPERPKDPTGTMVCPQQNKPCGPDCGAHNTFDMDRVGADVAKFRPDACSKDVCTFSKNMRAAQCVLGPESLKSPQKSKHSVKMPNLSPLDSQMQCYCGKHAVSPCYCKQDQRMNPRQEIIEEVMGEYREVKPIDRVANVSERQLSNKSSRRKKEGCVCSNKRNPNTNTSSKYRVLESIPRLNSDDFIVMWPDENYKSHDNH
ncbi:hypothetical protein O0L34_g5521 [Tuta absoluta]|nr:hypothetical protein O0L34_g5521 [Tuta absoluta]